MGSLGLVAGFVLCSLYFVSGAVARLSRRAYRVTSGALLYSRATAPDLEHNNKAQRSKPQGQNPKTQ